MLQLIRWLLVAPAALGGVYVGIFSMLISTQIVLQICSNVISGQCYDPWARGSDLACLWFSAALSAVLFVLLPSLLAPAYKRVVSWVALGLGTLCAGSMFLFHAAPALFVIVFTAGLITRSIFEKTFIRSVPAP